MAKAKAKAKEIKQATVLKSSTNVHITTGKVDDERYEQPLRALLSFNWRTVAWVELYYGQEQERFLGEMHIEDKATGQKWNAYFDFEEEQ